MAGKIRILFAFAAAALLAGCVTPQQEESQEEAELYKVMNVTNHDCLDYWGVAATDLVPLLKAEKDLNGKGWACRLPGESGTAIHIALRQLHTSLTTGLNEGWGTCPPRPQDLPPPTPAQIDVGTQALLVRNLLEADRESGIHAPYPLSGWLKRPNPDNPALVPARDLLQAVKEALDM